MNKKQWKHFLLFTLIVGSIVGIFSVISDNLPTFDLTITEIILSYLAVTLNSLAFWFIFAMLVGYFFANNLKEAALLGFLYTIYTITFYFVVSNFFTDIPITISIQEKITTYAIWYFASSIGGISGGIVGFLTKKTPYYLLLLLIGLIVQIAVNGSSNWNNTVGFAQNVTFILIIIAIIARLTFLNKKDNKKIS